MERTTTVEAGDTLSGIALREMGNAALWPKLFDRNRHIIRSEQERRGAERELRHAGVHDFIESDWIFPGTKLTVPSP